MRYLPTKRVEVGTPDGGEGVRLALALWESARRLGDSTAVRTQRTSGIGVVPPATGYGDPRGARGGSRGGELGVAFFAEAGDQRLEDVEAVERDEVGEAGGRAEEGTEGGRR